MEKEVDAIMNSKKTSFTVSDIVKMGIIPWARDNRTINNIIEADSSGYSVLKATVTSDKPYRRYLIARKNLIKYLKLYGPVLMATVRKQKSNGKKTRKVTTIITEKEEDFGITYDFSVSETHRYVSGPFLHHNCASWTHYTIINKMNDRGMLPHPGERGPPSPGFNGATIG